MKRISRIGLVSVCWLAGATGCTYADYGGLDISQQSSPPLSLGTPVEISRDSISIPVGAAVLVKAVPFSRNDQPYTAHDDLRLSSSNPAVFGLFEMERTTRIVLTGALVGDACLVVEINEEEVDCFQVHVTPQPTSGQ
jgi:hypothetical protein